MLLLQLLLMALSLPQSTTGIRFASEYDSPNQFEVTDGVFDIRGGRGRLRTPRLFSDFQLSFEFQRVTPDADASVTLRALTEGESVLEPAYRIALPVGSAKAHIVGSRKAVTTVEHAGVDAVETGIWQKVEIRAEIGRIRLTVNGALVGVYDVTSFTGYIIVSSKKGHARFRSFDLRELSPPFETPEGTVPLSGVEKTGRQNPRLVREVKPSYSIEAMQRKVEGVVWLEAIILADGSVGSVRVTKPLDVDLDHMSVATVRQWKFKPGTFHGKPVPTHIEVEMSYDLRR